MSCRIFLLRRFFCTIAEEISDAALVDGANEWQVMTRVIVPLAKPAIAAGRTLSVSLCVEQFFGPLLYTGSNPKVWTLAVALSQYPAVLHRSVLWNLQMAASVLFMLPRPPFPAMMPLGA